MRYSFGLLAVTLLVAGCGGGGDAGPDRFNLSGSVTFDGKPVEAGSVYIEPMPGNPGPVGVAVITNGKFDTAAQGGKGHIGGKLVIRIVPTLPPGQELADEFATPALPFSSWEEEVDLPKETTTKDITVPKDADAQMSKKQIRNAA